MNSTALNSPLQQSSLFKFPLHRCAKTKPITIPFARNSSFFVKSFSPLHSVRVRANAVVLRIVRCSVVDDVDNNRPRIQFSSFKRCNEANNALAVAKPIAYALFYIFVGVFCQFVGFQKPALAAVAATPPAAASKSVLREENGEKGHEYSHYTRRLLEAVSRLLKIIEEAKKAGNKDNKDFSANVEEGLKEVKMTKRALQEEIMNGLYGELRVLKGEKEALMDRSEEIVDKLFKAKREQESLMRKAKGVGDRIQRLREERRSWEKEYNAVWERIGEVEDLISRKETMALSIGVRELLSIERECEALVDGFLREMRSRQTQR